MQSVEEALAGVLAQAKRLPKENLPLGEALGRVLAEDACADTDLPPFTNSAVDGYALRASDTLGATPERPARLRVLGEVMAGEIAPTPLEAGTAIRVMTGAPVPIGADAMAMVEDTRLGERGEVCILEAARPKQHLRFRGEELRQGERALPVGTLIRAAEAGVLATLGYASVPVFRAPRVAIVSTGDELIGIEGGAPPMGKIRDSNRYALSALTREAGAVVHAMIHIPDDFEATERAFRQCVESGADVIITAGGVSVGDKDFVKPVLEKMGRLAFWRIAMKPGKPLAFGSIGDTLFFGLPGNPVSAMVTFELFARPVLCKMRGLSDAAWARPQVLSTLAEPIPHTPGRREYVRAVTLWRDSGYVSRMTGDQGSSRLSSMAQANSLIVVPQDSKGLLAGDVASALLLF